MDVLRDVGEVQVEAAVQGHLGGVAVLADAHVLGVLDGRQGHVAGGGLLWIIKVVGDGGWGVWEFELFFLGGGRGGVRGEDD